MSTQVSAAGWAVVDGERLDVRTVSPTRRAAIVNWLVTTAQENVYAWETDERIDARWERVIALRRGVTVREVSITTNA